MIEYHKNFSLESLFYIDEKGLVCQEEWRDIPDFKGFYQVSNLGRVKSLQRYVKGQVGLRIQKERILCFANRKARYVCLSLYGKYHKRIFLHQVVAMAFLNHKPCGNKFIIDHKNNISSDNRSCNLQVVTVRKNNSKDRLNKTGYLGVHKTKNGKYRAKINIDKKSKDLGCFDTPEEANAVYSKALSMLEKKLDISFLFKTASPSNTGIKYIYNQKGKFYFNKRIKNKTIRSVSYATIEEAISFSEKYKEDSTLI